MAIQTVKTGAAVNDGTGDDARTAFTKINQNFTDSSHAASRLVGTGAGNVMEVGVFGLGISGIHSPYSLINENFNKPTDVLAKGLRFGLVEGSRIGGSSSYCAAILMSAWHDTTATGAHPFILFSDNGHLKSRFPLTDASDWAGTVVYRSTRNTSVDPNGFIKNASPIVSLYADKIELNDEAKLQDITFEKLGVGDYLIKGSTGFAQEGWYVEMPKDANGNVLVAVVYEQLANNDISVKTYDYMLNKKGRIVPDLETPLDIPETRWIDLRLQALPQDDTQPLSKDETVATNAE